MKHGKLKAFYINSNSSYHQHIQSHYKLYKAQYTERGISEHHHALLRELLKVKEEAKKRNSQPGIDEMLRRGHKRQEFSRDDVMRTIAEFIVCDNQVSCCSKGWARSWGLTMCLVESCGG